MRVLRICIVMLSLSVGLLAADSPFSGTWKLKPPPGDHTSATAKVEADGQRFNLNQENVDDKGQSTTLKFDAKFDGKDYAVSGDPEHDSVSVDRINDRNVKVTFKKAGKRVGESDVTISNDGKTVTVNYTNFSQTTPQKNTSFWERQ
jgi:hypothetical protein